MNNPAARRPVRCPRRANQRAPRTKKRPEVQRLPDPSEYSVRLLDQEFLRLSIILSWNWLLA